MKPTADQEQQHWQIFETLMEMWDADKLIKYIESEYQRGRDDYRNELLAKMDVLRDVIAPAETTPKKKLIVHSIQEETSKPPETPHIAPKNHGAEGDATGAKDVDASPKKRERDVRNHGSPRPEGLPTTFTMIAIILRDCPGLTARETGDRIRERWWPGMDFSRIGPEFSTWITKGRLLRDHDGKLTLSDSGRRLAFPSVNPDMPEPSRPAEPKPAPTVRIFPTVPPKEPTRSIASPPAQPTAGKKPHMFFEYGGAKVELQMPEYVIASRLHIAMGKGHLDVSTLANSLGNLKKGTADNAILLRSMCSVISDKIAKLGLKIDYYEGFGFVMKEIDGAALAAE